MINFVLTVIVIAFVLGLIQAGFRAIFNPDKTPVVDEAEYQRYVAKHWADKQAKRTAEWEEREARTRAGWAELRAMDEQRAARRALAAGANTRG